MYGNGVESELTIIQHGGQFFALHLAFGRIFPLHALVRLHKKANAGNALEGLIISDGFMFILPKKPRRASACST